MYKHTLWRGTWLLLLAVCAVTSPRAVSQKAKSSDELTFANGDHLTGTLERATGKDVVFKSDMAGELTVPIGKIKELRTAGKFVVLTKGEKNVRTEPPVAGTLLVKDGSIELLNGGGEVARTVPPARESYILDAAAFDQQIAHTANLLEGWSGTITAGATLLRSSTNSSIFNAAASFTREIPTVPYLPPRNRTVVAVTESYGNSTSVDTPATAPLTYSTTKTSIFEASAERDEYLSGKQSYFLGSVDFQHNFSQGLTLQQIYGLGFGYTVLKDDVQQFNIKAEAHYERQSFQNSASDHNLIGATFAEMYERTLPLKIRFTENANYIPAFNDLHAYAANLTTGLTLPAYKRLGVNFSVLDNYLNDADYPYQKNSFQFTTGLTYALH